MKLGAFPGIIILEAYLPHSLNLGIPGTGGYSDTASKMMYTEFWKLFPILGFQEANNQAHAT